MEDHRREYSGTRPDLVWQVAHVVATITVPWLLVSYYFGSEPLAITGGDDNTDQLLSRMHFERKTDLPSVEVKITINGKDTVACANAAAQTMVHPGFKGDRPVAR